MSDLDFIKDLVAAKKRWSENEIKRGEELLEAHKSNESIMNCLKKSIQTLGGCVLTLEALESDIKHYESNRD